MNSESHIVHENGRYHLSTKNEMVTVGKYELLDILDILNDEYTKTEFSQEDLAKFEQESKLNFLDLMGRNMDYLQELVGEDRGKDSDIYSTVRNVFIALYYYMETSTDGRKEANPDED